LGEVASAPLFEGRWVFFCGHQTLEEVLGYCWSMKIDLSPPIILFYGDEGFYWGFVGDAHLVNHSQFHLDGRSPVMNQANNLTNESSAVLLHGPLLLASPASDLRPHLEHV
jgi:hypothetical protein